MFMAYWPKSLIKQLEITIYNIVISNPLAKN